MDNENPTVGVYGVDWITSEHDPALMAWIEHA